MIYFLFFGHVILYQAKWVLPFTVLTLVALVAALLFGVKRKILTVRGLTLSFLLWAIGISAAGGSSALLWWTLRALRLVNSSFTSAYNAQLYAVAFVALVAAMVSGYMPHSVRGLAYITLLPEHFFFCGTLMLATQVFASAATYLLNMASDVRPASFGLRVRIASG